MLINAESVISLTVPGKLLERNLIEVSRCVHIKLYPKTTTTKNLETFSNSIFIFYKNTEMKGNYSMIFLAFFCS